MPFDPSVIEKPRARLPDYASTKFMNPDQDAYVTYEQAIKIAEACYDPSLSIAEAVIPKTVGEYKAEDQPREYRYHGEWTNGFRNDLPAMGIIFDTKGLRTGLKSIYDEMRQTGFDVPWWVYDKVK